MFHFLLLSLTSRGCFSLVLLRFCFKRFFTSAHPDSQNFLVVWLCDGWGNVEKQGLAFHHSLPLAWRSSGGAQGIQSSWPIDSLAEPFSSVPDVVVVRVLIMLTSAYWCLEQGCSFSSVALCRIWRVEFSIPVVLAGCWWRACSPVRPKKPLYCLFKSGP